MQKLVIYPAVIIKINSLTHELSKMENLNQIVFFMNLNIRYQQPVAQETF